MPSQNKRVNLTFPPHVYEQLQAYKARKGIANDAGACMQLIVQQLAGEERLEGVMRLAQSLTMEQLMQLSQEGLAVVKNHADEQKDR